jgi:hypothetical protein
VTTAKIQAANVLFVEARSQLRESQEALRALWPQPTGVVYLAAADDLRDEEAFGVIDKQRAQLASFETVPRDANRRHSLAVEEQARFQALAMRRAYEMSALAAVHRAARE